MSRKQQAWGTTGTLRGDQRAAATLMTPTDARELTATTSYFPETGQERRRRGLGGANPDLMCDCWAYLCGWYRWAHYETCVATHGGGTGAAETCSDASVRDDSSNDVRQQSLPKSLLALRAAAVMQLLCIFDDVTSTVSRAYKIIIIDEIFLMQCNQHSVLWVHLQLTQATLFNLRAEREREIITSFPAISGLIRRVNISFCKHSSVKRTLIISTANIHLFQTHHNDGYAWPFLDIHLHECLTKTGIHDLQNHVQASTRQSTLINRFV